MTDPTAPEVRAERCPWCKQPGGTVTVPPGFLWHPSCWQALHPASAQPPTVEPTSARERLLLELLEAAEAVWHRWGSHDPRLVERLKAACKAARAALEPERGADR